MARKRKNSTALFEVISAGRVDRKPVAAALKTPRWWFKGQSGAIAAADEAPSPVTLQTDPADPTANVTAASLYLARQRMAPTQAPQSTPAPIAVVSAPAAHDAYAAADLQDIGLGVNTAPAGPASGSAQRPL